VPAGAMAIRGTSHGLHWEESLTIRVSKLDVGYFPRFVKYVPHFLLSIDDLKL
jgi:hypothetical protein